MWLWKNKQKCHRHVLSVSLCACSVCSCGFHWPFFQSRICLISSALLPPWAHLPVFEGFSKLLSSPVFLRLAQPASYPCLSPVFCPVLFKVMLSFLFLLLIFYFAWCFFVFACFLCCRDWEWNFTHCTLCLPSRAFESTFSASMWQKGREGGQ